MGGEGKTGGKGDRREVRRKWEGRGRGRKGRGREGEGKGTEGEKKSSPRIELSRQ